MSAPTEVEFLRAEVAHWKAECERVEAVLARIGTEAMASTWATATPPEPPVGTRFVEGDVAAWEHLEDGWFCARVGCPHCPAAWGEVLGHLRDGAERVLPAGEEANVR